MTIEEFKNNKDALVKELAESFSKTANDMGLTHKEFCNLFNGPGPTEND